MSDPNAKHIFILGLTHAGKVFRPSDWAERLAGVMSSFRPGGAQNRHHPASYSPWCVPNTLNGTKCVVVDVELRQAEPMAFDFVMNFARDNDLQMVEGCMLPTPEAIGGASSPAAALAPKDPQRQAQTRFLSHPGLQFQA